MFGRCIIFRVVCRIVLVLATCWAGGQSWGASPSIVSVQVGEHPDFFRVSLTWPEPVNFQYDVNKNSFEIRFFHKAELLLDRLNKVFPGSYYKHEGDQTVLTLNVSPTRKFEARSYGNITYLDVHKTEAPGASVIVNQPTPLPKPAVAPLASLKEKTQEVDLTKLFKKVADYLDDVSGNTNSTISLAGENGILLKYPDSPISVYETEDSLNVVVLKNEDPIFDKRLERKYAVQYSSFNEGFLVQLPREKLNNVLISKNPEGWRLDFSPALIDASVPRLLMKDETGKFKLSRTGLIDPVDVNGIRVFCTVDPTAFVPLQTVLPDMQIFPSSIGVAVKLNDPQAMTVDRDFITFSSSEAGISFEKPNKINFNLSGGDSFLAEKAELVQKVVANENGSPERWVDLILWYLGNGFSAEADSELVALKYQYPEFETEKMILLRVIATIAEELPQSDLGLQLFDIHKKSLENLAWYAFLQSQTNNHKIPVYLGEYLIGAIASFPNPLKSILSLNLADQLVSQKEGELAEKSLLNIGDRHLSTELLLLKQFLQMKAQPREQGTMDFLVVERLLRQTKNPVLMARLIIEGEVIEGSKKDAQPFIEMLESLVPLLEGSPTQLKVIEYLLNHYVKAKNYLEVLNKGAVLQKKYPRVYQRIKPSIQNILYSIISEKGFEKIGLIYTLQILNQFVDALPLNEYVTDFIIDLTKKLSRIGLTKETILLLESYIGRDDLKLKLDKQEELFFQLIDLYLQEGNEPRAERLISILESRNGLEEIEIQTVQLLKARLAMARNQTEKVLDFLQNNHLLPGLKMKVRVLWDQQNWSGAADGIAEIIERYSEQLEEERKERYIVHLAAALVLNESKYKSKSVGRQKTKLTLQQVTREYEKVLDKYKVLFQELITEPHNSLQENLRREVILEELQETDRMEKLFDQVKAIPTH